jgi:hypothetical protein
VKHLSGLFKKFVTYGQKSFIGFAPVGPHTSRIELPGCFGINKLATNYLHLLLGLDRQTDGQIDRYSGRKTDRQMEKEREKEKDGSTEREMSRWPDLKRHE